MPAPGLAQQPQAIPNQLGSGPSSATDPAASLREAALLTLKSRRRKLGSGSEPAGIPPRPQVVQVTSVEPSIQLDYGQEEPSGGSSTASVSSVAQSAKSATPEPEEDDGQGREEGEISDSEPTPASPVAQPEVAREAKIKPAPRAVVKPPTPAKPIPNKTTTAPGPSPPRESNDVSGQSASDLMPPPPPPLPYVLDEKHVRPGLEMTQAHYNAAKDLVLDLLGWGVPPEYLVSCGVSREIMFYVFTELNLRLPPNFDATGIPPYPPSPMALNAAPTVTLIKRTDPMTLRAVNSVAKLSANGQSSSSQTTLSATANTFIPVTAASSSTGPNLFDMEQQRRQELLARKAAIASRKKQQVALLSSAPVGNATVATTESQDVEMADATPTKTVDDFLKSIGPDSEKDNGKGKAPARPISAVSFSTTSDAMDVDEVIPGLSIDTMMTSAVQSPQSYAFVQSPTSTRATPVSAIGPQSTVESVTSTTNGSLESVASSSGERSPANPSPSEVEAVPGLSFNPVASNPEPSRREPLARRGTKRPVAADFDDDAQPPIPRPRPNHSNGASRNPYHQPSFKRSVGTFSGLSNMRRCVIDLSDSEDEEEEEEGAIPSKHDDGLFTRPPSAARAVPRRGASVARQSPPGRGSATPTAMTPAALQEKEQEIRQMRELIAQREQSRLRKLVTMSRSTPTSTAETPVANGGPSTVPPEENTSSHTSTGSSTPTALGSSTVHLPAFEQCIEDLLRVLYTYRPCFDSLNDFYRH
ncbi:hypothetical protein EVJ58_g5315 [Rhodofomes roseus]|uniref:Uncharacterized protein n=1 Tax=Rhodofomes roseus TaxID=34475 RepID=A0A4Y9YE69_9APHY|nr:hypothetical protein EVJ58_g5315 [Rhodofomes roseus]